MSSLCIEIPINFNFASRYLEANPWIESEFHKYCKSGGSEEHSDEEKSIFIHILGWYGEKLYYRLKSLLKSNTEIEKLYRHGIVSLAPKLIDTLAEDQIFRFVNLKPPESDNKLQKTKYYFDIVNIIGGEDNFKKYVHDLAINSTKQAPYTIENINHIETSLYELFEFADTEKDKMYYSYCCLMISTALLMPNQGRFLDSTYCILNSVLCNEMDMKVAKEKIVSKTPVNKIDEYFIKHTLKLFEDIENDS